MIAKKKKYDGSKLATKVTAAMATWTFVFVFLAACLIEIALNTYGIVHFDPDTIKLNLMLSLMAAIQGSIIMIDQRRADSKRDALLQKLLQLEKRIVKDIEGEDSHGKRV